MQIDPQRGETARDAALRALAKQLPPPADRAAENQLLSAATLGLLGHSSGRDSGPPDSAPKMLGGPAPDEQAAQTPSPLGLESSFGDLGGDSSKPSALPFADPMAADALPPGAAVSGSALVPRTDFSAALAGFQTAPRTFLGSVYSGYEADGTPASPSDAAVGLSDGVERPGDTPAFLPTALPPAGSGPPPGSATPSAADINASDPSASDSLGLPASWADNGGGFEAVAAAPSLDSAAGDATDALAADEAAGDVPPSGDPGAAISPALAASASAATDSRDASSLAVEIFLSDAAEIAAMGAEKFTALAAAAAESAVDERFGEVGDRDCLRIAGARGIPILIVPAGPVRAGFGRGEIGTARNASADGAADGHGASLGARCPRLR